MNVNSAAQLLQTGFRTALGASSAIAELLNNPQKLADIIAQPPRSPEQLLLDLAARGESIEQEAHKFGETFLSGGSHHFKPPQYIERAGEQCFLQPYDIKGTNLYGFILEGSLHKLQAVCQPKEKLSTALPCTMLSLLSEQWIRSVPQTNQTAKRDMFLKKR
jgi:hypothetical protein